VLLGFRNGPGLPFTYLRRAATVLAGGEVLVGEPAEADRPVATFTPSDLPVALASVATSAAVLEHGNLVVTATYVRAGEPRTLVALLTPLDPGATFAVPDPDGDTRLAIVLQQRDGTGQVDLGTRPYGPLVIDIDQVPTVGTQVVELRVDGSTSRLAAYELRADDPRSPTPPETLAFVDGHDVRSWSYVVVDPFRPGVRYRAVGAADGPTNEWSQPHDPTEPLSLAPLDPAAS
jgi:hypothetical protein